VFSLVPRLSTRHCPHLLLNAVACYRSISLTRDSLSSKPAARRCCCRLTRHTDGRTDGRTLERCNGYSLSMSNTAARLVRLSARREYITTFNSPHSVRRRPGVRYPLLLSKMNSSHLLSNIQKKLYVVYLYGLRRLSAF